jgi:hypothetical protein
MEANATLKCEKHRGKQKTNTNIAAKQGVQLWIKKKT